MASHPAPPGGAAPADSPPPGGSHESWLHDVAAYAMNALPPDEAFLVSEHISECPECQTELAQLRELTADLGQVPDQAFLDGPPENAELLIRGTLRRIRAEGPRRSAAAVQLTASERAAGGTPSGSSGRPRFLALAVAAAAVVLAVAVGGVVGRSTAPERDVAIGEPPTPSATPAVPGTRQATSTDSKSGATLTAQVIPAAGWVRVTASTAGIKAGEKCTLYVVSRTGKRVQAGGWLVSEKGAAQGVVLQGSALTAPADVAAVEVENAAGTVLVRTEV